MSSAENDRVIAELKSWNRKAKALYEASTDNDPIIHCNRFPSWNELNGHQRGEWVIKAKQKEGALCGVVQTKREAAK